MIPPVTLVQVMEGMESLRRESQSMTGSSKSVNPPSICVSEMLWLLVSVLVAAIQVERTTVASAAWMTEDSSVTSTFKLGRYGRSSTNVVRYSLSFFWATSRDLM